MSADVELQNISVTFGNFFAAKNVSVKIEKGELKHKKVDTDLRKEFQKWRQSKKYSQKDVAIKLSVTPQIISKFENGQLNHDPKVVSKIKRLMKK